MQKIMFNDHFQLTDAVIAGRKTQTRRIIIPQPEYNEGVSTKYKLGEIVAVAQSYQTIQDQRECGH